MFCFVVMWVGWGAHFSASMLLCGVFGLGSVCVAWPYDEIACVL